MTAGWARAQYDQPQGGASTECVRGQDKLQSVCCLGQISDK